MLKLDMTHAYKRDLRKSLRQGKCKLKLEEIINLLLENKPLPQSVKLHSLKGKWINHFECHVEPNWLLVFCKDHEVLTLARIASHSEIFG